MRAVKIDQIIIHTSETGGSEPEHEMRSMSPSCLPYSILLCGPTGCGKTTQIVDLRHHEELCTHTPKKLIWIYGVEQPDLFETIWKIWFPRQCEFVAGCPDNLLTRPEQTSDRGSLCIFDDVMNEVSSNSSGSKLFMCGRSHLGCSRAVASGGAIAPPSPQSQKTIFLKRQNLGARLRADLFLSSFPS